MRAIVAELAEIFRKQTGHPVALVVGTAGELRHRAALEPADVVIVTDRVVDELVSQGILAEGTRVDLAHVGVGVAVRRRACVPEISSCESLRQTLLAARSFAYPDPDNGATAGIHMAEVLQRLGIADALAPRAVLRPSGAAACEAVARGAAELGATQISEILAEPGVELVGPLPPELQKVTVYSGAIAARSATPELARALLALLTRPDYRAKFAAAGLDYRD
jgi:molybdate transport system substrate-binding protein